MPVELLLLLIKPYTNLTRSSVCAPPPSFLESYRYGPETWTTATKEAADPSLVAIAAFPEVAEKAFSEEPRCSSPRST